MGRYPFKRGSFPSRPLAVRPASALSIFGPAHSAIIRGASVIAASPPQASSSRPLWQRSPMHMNPPRRQRPVWHRLLRRPNGRPAVAPTSLGRVTNAGCRACSSPPFHEDWPSLRHRPRGGTGSEENLCSNRLMMEEPQKWREPRRDGFEARSVWSLFNAFTESLKDETLPS